MELKAALRRRVSAQLKAVTTAQRAVASVQARALLAQQRHWQRAGSILLYAPMAEELDVWSLLVQALAAGKVVALPRFRPETKTYIACQVLDAAHDVGIGHFGIREPSVSCPEIPLNRLDLVLVPGVAFDFQGRRLGRGKGFYDRLLADVHGVKCGVGFDEQIVEVVPVGPLDVHLDCILTPTRWVEAKRSEDQSAKLEA